MLKVCKDCREVFVLTYTGKSSNGGYRYIDQHGKVWHCTRCSDCKGKRTKSLDSYKWGKTAGNRRRRALLTEHKRLVKGLTVFRNCQKCGSKTPNYRLCQTCFNYKYQNYLNIENDLVFCG